jgi:hypothetical protein
MRHNTLFEPHLDKKVFLVRKTGIAVDSAATMDSKITSFACG